MSPVSGYVCQEEEDYWRENEGKLPIEEIIDLSDNPTRLYLDPIDRWEREANRLFPFPEEPVLAEQYFVRTLSAADQQLGEAALSARFSALTPQQRLPFVLLEKRDVDRYRLELDERNIYFLPGTYLSRRYTDGVTVWWRCLDCFRFNGHEESCKTQEGVVPEEDLDEGTPWHELEWSWGMWRDYVVDMGKLARTPYCIECNREGCADLLVQCAYACGAGKHSYCFRPEPYHTLDVYWECGSTRHEPSFVQGPCFFCGTLESPRIDCSQHRVCQDCLKKAVCYICCEQGVEMFCPTCCWRGVHIKCLPRKMQPGPYTCFVCIDVHGFGSKQLPDLEGAHDEYREMLKQREMVVCNHWGRLPGQRYGNRIYANNEEPYQCDDDSGEEGEEEDAEALSEQDEILSSEDVPLGELKRRLKEEEAFGDDDIVASSSASSSEDIPLGKLALAKKSAAKTAGNARRKSLEIVANPAKPRSDGKDKEEEEDEEENAKKGQSAVRKLKWEKADDGFGWRPITMGSRRDGCHARYGCKTEACDAIRTVRWGADHEVISDVTEPAHNHGVPTGPAPTKGTDKYPYPVDGFAWKERSSYNYMKSRRIYLRCRVAGCRAERHVKYDRSKPCSDPFEDEYVREHNH